MLKLNKNKNNTILLGGNNFNKRLLLHPKHLKNALEKNQTIIVTKEASITLHAKHYKPYFHACEHNYEQKMSVFVFVVSFVIEVWKKLVFKNYFPFVVCLI